MDAFDVALQVASAFERCRIDYFLGGSMASSLQGEPRSTNDIDFVVAMSPRQVERLALELGSDFDVDESALRDALRRGKSWSFYFLPRVTKIDLFPRGDEPFDASEFSRRRPIEARPGQRVWIKSPEDTVLRKLLWFREGGSVSTTQWRDVIEVLRVSGPGLERAYLDRWAGELGLAALLTKAQDEASKA